MTCGETLFLYLRADSLRLREKSVFDRHLEPSGTPRCPGLDTVCGQSALPLWVCVFALARSRLRLLPGFLPPDEADWIFSKLLAELPWSQKTNYRQGGYMLGSCRFITVLEP